MVYIKRDKDGKISALYNSKTSSAKEEGDLFNPEVLDFLVQNPADPQKHFIKHDLQFIRVLEDLIVILIEKNILTITDFPAPVIEKLLQRQTIRKHFLGAFGMEFNGSDENT